MRQFFLAFLEILEILVVALVSIYLVYAFIAQPFRVEGSSMEPNFSSGDYLIVDEISYRFREPERGEVIVLKNPTDESKFFIKRIIGLPGEEIIVSDNKVFVNGEKISESYLPDSAFMVDTPPFHLASNEYFVMGDNRAGSYDSRRWGPLGEHQIIGVVRLRFLPLTQVEIFKSSI